MSIYLNLFQNRVKISEILYENLHALLSIIRYANRTEKCLSRKCKEIFKNNQYTFSQVLRLFLHNIIYIIILIIIIITITATLDSVTQIQLEVNQINNYSLLLLMKTGSRIRAMSWVCGRSLAMTECSNLDGGMDVLSVLCCQAEVTVTGRSPVRRCLTEYDLKTSKTSWPRPTRTVKP